MNKKLTARHHEGISRNTPGESGRLPNTRYLSLVEQRGIQVGEVSSKRISNVSLFLLDMSGKHKTKSLLTTRQHTEAVISHN